MDKIFFEGFALQASLIFALGAQNLFVLEAGARRSHHLTVSLVCFLCDLTLILLGVAGAATIFNLFPSLKILIGIIGVAFLFFYGVGKMTDQSTMCKTEESQLLSLKKSALLAVTFSILNPHAYLDAFVLIGGYSSKYAALDERLMLGLGAAIYSGLWFLGLSTFSSWMKPLLCDQKRMRFVSVCTGSILVFLSAKLAMDLVSWMPELDLRSYTFATIPGPGALLYSSILY
jgi:L-lysine exporter family protein LysE/ArgO